MSHTEERSDLYRAGFDPDEDLFDFAGVAREPETDESETDLEEIFASLREDVPEEELLAPIANPAPLAPARIEPPAPLPQPVPEAITSLPRKPSASTPWSDWAANDPRAAEPAPAPRPSRFSRGVVAAALSMTLINSVLAVVVLRGRGSAGDVRAVDGGAEARSEEARQVAAAPVQESRQPDTSFPDAGALAPEHDHPAMDEAREEISRGEYAAARQKVYSLLAIIDRLEEPRRGALEADCQFLIAQSLHLEALAQIPAARGRAGGAQ